MRNLLIIFFTISINIVLSQTGAFKLDGNVVSGDTIFRTSQDLTYSFYKDFKFVNASPDTERFKLKRVKEVSTINESEGNEILDFNGSGFEVNFIDSYLTLGSGSNISGSGGEVIVNKYFSFSSNVSGELIMKYILNIEA